MSLGEEPSTDGPADPASGLYGPDGRPQFFSDPAMDRFVATLLNLASEVWTQQEQILDLIDARADGAGPTDREEALKRYIDRVFAPMREQSPP